MEEVREQVILGETGSACEQGSEYLGVGEKAWTKAGHQVTPQIVPRLCNDERTLMSMLGNLAQLSGKC